MSDSQSQSNQSFNMGQVPQEHQAHTKQILQKGKKIVPTYDQATLYQLFKRYYSVDSIFYNELNIIARRLKGDFDDQHQKKNWINVGRVQRTKVNQSKYNFLQDKQLIRRAEQYLKNKEVLPQRRQYAQGGENKPQNNYRHNNNQDNRQNSNYNNKPVYDRKPKQKFVQKIEPTTDKPVQKATVETSANKVDTPIHKLQNAADKVVKMLNVVHKLKDEEKPVQYLEKVEPKQAVHQTSPSTQQKPAQNNKSLTQTSTVKVQQTPTPKVTQAKKTQPVVKKQQQKKQVLKPQKYIQKKEVAASKPVQKASEPTKISEPTKAAEPTKQQSKTTKQQPKPTTTSITQVKNYDLSAAQKNFSQACKQNSFILKFIKPQAYLQKVSYIRTADGQIKNAQIRVAGTKNENN